MPLFFDPKRPGADQDELFAHQIQRLAWVFDTPSLSAIQSALERYRPSRYSYSASHCRTCAKAACEARCGRIRGLLPEAQAPARDEPDDA